MNVFNLLNALPGAVAQGLIWGIMAIGVYITYRILDFADLTVDGSLCTGGAVCIMMMLSGHNVFVSMLAATAAGMVTGLATGLFHTFMGIPPILSGILTQLSLYSVNLKIMGKANQAINVYFCGDSRHHTAGACSVLVLRDGAWMLPAGYRL